MGQASAQVHVGKSHVEHAEQGSRTGQRLAARSPQKNVDIMHAYPSRPQVHARKIPCTPSLLYVLASSSCRFCLEEVGNLLAPSADEATTELDASARREGVSGLVTPHSTLPSFMQNEECISPLPYSGRSPRHRPLRRLAPYRKDQPRPLHHLAVFASLSGHSRASERSAYSAS
jgi:hypothetical protein